MSRDALLALLALTVALAACGDPPTCEQVARHIEALARADAGPRLTVAPHAELVRNCEAGDPALRACVLRATSLYQVKDCELASRR